MRNVLSALILVSFSGCVIYDEHIVYDDRPMEDPLPDTEPQPDPTGDMRLSFTPDTASQGDIVLASLRSTNAPEDFDLRRIAGIQFYGPSSLDIVTSQPRNRNEFQFVVRVAGPSLPGVNDLLVTLPNGTVALLSEAFEVIGDPLDNTCN